MNIPCWSGTRFWDDLEQFTSPKSRVHHGQRTGADLKGTGDSVALTWHWDQIIFDIISFLNANLYDCQTRLGWKQLVREYVAANRSTEVLMDSVLHASDKSAAADALRVV
eukprot:5475006-Heterocapsa_arctica.AAC.1